MSCHTESSDVADSGTNLNGLDVYEADGKVVEVVDPATGQVRVDVSCEQLKNIYNSSTANLVSDFDGFANAVETEASVATSEVYTPVAALNESWEGNTAAQRASIRICIRWRWLRIYIRIKF